MDFTKYLNLRSMDFPIHEFMSSWPHESMILRYWIHNPTILMFHHFSAIWSTKETDTDLSNFKAFMSFTSSAKPQFYGPAYSRTCEITTPRIYGSKDPRVHRPTIHESTSPRVHWSMNPQIHESIILFGCASHSTLCAASRVLHTVSEKMVTKFMASCTVLLVYQNYKTGTVMLCQC